MKTKKPKLYIFSGLPGTGKTTLSQKLCKKIDAFYLRIDTIEQTLRDFIFTDIQEEGYKLAYKIAAENLSLGKNVIADSCNPINLTRREWQKTATESNADFVNIEVICSDTEEHRRRIETRLSDVSGLVLPNWENVKNREYHPWSSERIIIDTANKTLDKCFHKLEKKLLLLV